MKKFIALLVSVLLILSLCACGDRVDEEALQAAIDNLNRTLAVSTDDSVIDSYTFAGDRNGVTATIISELGLELAALVSSGAGMDSWITVRDLIVEQYNNIRAALDEAGYESVPLDVRFLGDSDSGTKLVIIEEGVITYDILAD